jgi:hypothetical protein
MMAVVSPMMQRTNKTLGAGSLLAAGLFHVSRLSGVLFIGWVARVVFGL